MRRLTKYVLAILGLGLLGGLWAFSHFLFNPFEDRFGFPLSTLLPRDVDFYAAKGELAEDFDAELEPLFLARLRDDPRARVWLEIEAVRDALAGLQYEARMAELRKSLDALPIEVHPLEVFGGSGVALGGYLGGAQASDATWALVGRVNWIGKLGMAAIGGGLVDVSTQGFRLIEIPDGFGLSGGQLTQPLFFTRHLDVVAVASSAELIARVRGFIEARGQDSFGLSAKFQDHRAAIDTDDEDLDLYVDRRALAPVLGLPSAWPNPRAEGLAEALAGRLFQLGFVRELLASVEFGNGLTTHLSGSLSSEDMDQRQKRFYRLRGFEKREVLEFARFAPKDVGLFTLAHVNLNDLLTMAVEALDPATLTLLEDPARNVWGYADIHPLLSDISQALGDQVAFFLRNNDYPDDTSDKAPLHDDAVVLAWAAVFPVDDPEALDKLQAHVQRNPAAFGLRGRTPTSGSIFSNTVSGVVSLEYHSPFVPGTGHIAMTRVFGPDNELYLIVSNHNKLVNQAFDALRSVEGSASLAKERWFETLVSAGLPSADVLAYANPRAIGDTLRKIAEVDAGFDVELAINWSLERPRLERRVLAEHFPGEQYGEVSAENREAYEVLVEEAVQAFKRQFVREHQGRLQREYERPFAAAELMQCIFAELSIDPKGFRMFDRFVLDEPAEN